MSDRDGERAGRHVEEFTMRRFSYLLVCCAFVLAAPFAEGKSLEADLQLLLSQFTSAWDKSDAGGIAALFEGNADLVIPDGLMVEGREAIQQFYASVFQRGYRGSRGKARIKHVRTIGTGMVLVDGVWRIDGAVFDGRPEAPEVGVFNLVVKRRGKKWTICSLREQTSARDLLRQSDSTTAEEPQQPEAVGGSQSDADSIDRARIQELEQEDIAASKKNDVEALVALWTDDGVLLQPGASPVIGKEAIRKLLFQQQQQAARVETISYEENWNEVRITGVYAFEWGQIGATLKLPNGKDVQHSVNAIRILAKQPDGSWRVARVAITPANRH